MMMSDLQLSFKNSVQVAAEDMRLFVEMLQSFCEDPRDLAEVRLSEAKLKSQLSSAQKQLQGQEVQVNYVFGILHHGEAAAPTSKNLFYALPSSPL